MTRAPRPLTIAPELARRLGATRRDRGIDAEPTVNLDRLQDLEAALGITFEDDVLALFAAHVPELGAELARVVGITGELRERGMRGDWIGLGVLEPGLYLCLAKRRQLPGQSELFVVDVEARDQRSLSILDLLDERGSTGSADFAPRLVRPTPESTRHGRRVRHKVFGEGRLLSEIGTGPERKCKVDFPGVGLKLLHGRFLEPVDD